MTIDAGSYFELTATDMATDLRKRTVLTLEEMGIPVEHAQHEDAPSQHEIDLRYTDALTMADTVMTVRLVVKETAQRRRRARELHAQAARGRPGLGHAHPPVAVRRRDQRLLRPRGPLRLVSDVAKRFIAGLLRHAHEITAVTNQWVNSYKRLVSGYEAPIHVSWARNNRSALIRVPVVKRRQARVHPHRVPGARLGLQPLSGLRRDPGRRPEGHRGGLRTAPRGGRQPVRHDRRGARRRGHTGRCPGASTTRSTRWSAPSWWPRPSGEHVFEWFIRNKRAEWAAYKTHISQFELDRYLPLL